MKAQNQNVEELPFQAVLGVFGSYVGLFLNILCIIAQFYIAVAPIGGKATAYDFFVAMLALPIILACFIGWKIWHGTKFMRASEMDLITGRRELDLAESKAEELAERATWPTWKKYVPPYTTNVKGFIIGSVKRVHCFKLFRFR